MIDTDNAMPSIDDWIARDAIALAIDQPTSLAAATDRLLADLGGSIQVLALGEPLHGGEEFFLLRNRLLRHLVQQHGFTTLALESSFPRGRLVNEFIAGRGSLSSDDVLEAGFSHNFGRLEANRELILWMREYNSHAASAAQLQFYGFDSPTEVTTCDGPRQTLQFLLDCLAELDPVGSQARRERITPLLGDDSRWENPAVAFDSTQGIGRSSAAVQLRLETEDLISELEIRGPELAATCGPEHLE